MCGARESRHLDPGSNTRTYAVEPIWHVLPNRCDVGHQR
jgi:hypothetical protein